jgi:hypothetical protein
MADDPYPHFYELESQPLRWQTKVSLPELMRPDGTFRDFTDFRAFSTKAVRISEREFRKLAAEWTTPIAAER